MDDASYLSKIKNLKKKENKQLPHKSFHIKKNYNDAWMGIGAISIGPPKNGMVNLCACLILLKDK
jgi:hypothetical protein